MKEESSEPIVIEAVVDSSGTMLLISEQPDGTPIKTVEDLYSVFKSRAFITVTREINSQTVEFLASPILFQKTTKDDQPVAAITLYVGDTPLVTTEELYSIMGSGH